MLTHECAQRRVSQFRQQPISSEKPRYIIQAYLTWDSVESLKKGLESDGSASIFADVAKFPNVKPIFIVGDVTGQSTVVSREETDFD
jgi:uncharacterized protein (TIGR02118 family)